MLRSEEGPLQNHKPQMRIATKAEAGLRVLGCGSPAMQRQSSGAGWAGSHLKCICMCTYASHAVQVSVAVRGVAASSLVECELRARLPNRVVLARQGPPSIDVLMAVA